jgi:hypothetical protein
MTKVDGSLIFLRGILRSEERKLLTFSGTIKEEAEAGLGGITRPVPRTRCDTQYRLAEPGPYRATEPATIPDLRSSDARRSASGSTTIGLPWNESASKKSPSPICRKFISERRYPEPILS